MLRERERETGYPNAGARSDHFCSEEEQDHVTRETAVPGTCAELCVLILVICERTLAATRTVRRSSAPMQPSHMLRWFRTRSPAKYHSATRSSPGE